MADVAMLVVAAGLGEFEAGVSDHGWFLGGAQNSLPLLVHNVLMSPAGTSHHLMLAKSLGMSKVIVVVNKMDDRSVNYSQARFNVLSLSLERGVIARSWPTHARALRSATGDQG
jgi:translation elongation factor EF-1alpha